MMRATPQQLLALVLCLLFLPGLGCSGIRSVSDAQLPEVTPRTERVVLAPIRSQVEAGRQADHGVAMAVDMISTQRRFEQLFKRLYPLLEPSYREDLRGDTSGLLREARLRGFEELLEVTIQRKRVAYRGLNFWWGPNLLLYISLWLPSFLVADEEYEAEYSFRVDLYQVETGRLTWSRSFSGIAAENLDDLDRGVLILGTIRVPLFEDIGDSNWLQVWRSLGSMARFEAESQMLRALDERARVAGASGASDEAQVRKGD